MSLFSLLAAVSFVSFPAVFAQEPETPSDMGTVSTVTMEGASLGRSEDGTFVATFGISNRKGVQSGIRYGIEVRGNGGGTVDSMVFPEQVVLTEGEAKTLSFRYETPSYLPAGSYEVWVASWNTSGLPLGLIKLGDIDVDSPLDRSGVFIDAASCHLDIGEDRYGLGVKPMIDASQKLPFSCDVLNVSSDARSVFPKYAVYRGAVSGSPVIEELSKGERITLLPSERKTVEFSFPRKSDPQSYEVALSLADVSDRSNISNTVRFGYDVSGPSATILNVVLDGASYLKGDEAEAWVSFDAQSDHFSGRVLTLSAVLTSGETACSESVRKEVPTSARPFPVLTVGFPVTADCENPVVSVSLSDTAGNILDSRSYGVVPVVNEAALMRKPVSTPALVTGLSLVVIILIGTIIMRRCKNQISFPIILVALVVSFFWSGSAPAAGLAGLSFSVLPGSGLAPLGVTLSATVVGGAPEGSVSYTFEFDCTNDGIWDRRVTVSRNNYTISGVCGYTNPGTYTVKAKASSATWSSVVTTPVSVYSSKPAPDLKINSSNGPVYEYPGLPLNITWGNVAGATSCTGSGPGWSGSKAVTGGNDRISAPSYNATYTLSCSGPGGTGADSVLSLVRVTTQPLSCGPYGRTYPCGSNCVYISTPPTDSASLCTVGTPSAVANAAYGNYAAWNWTCSRGTESITCMAFKTSPPPPPTPSFVICPDSPTIYVGGAQQMRAYYKPTGTPVTCSNTSGASDVTSTTNWSGANTAASVKNTTGEKGVVTGLSAGSAVITGQGTLTDSATVSVIRVCASNCSAQAASHCQGETFTTQNSCGTPETCTNAGTRYCDFNRKEVAPGS